MCVAQVERTAKFNSKGCWKCEMYVAQVERTAKFPAENSVCFNFHNNRTSGDTLSFFLERN